MKSERSLARNSVLAGARPANGSAVPIESIHGGRASCTPLHHQRMPSHVLALSGIQRLFIGFGRIPAFSGFGSCTYEARHCGQRYMTSDHRVAGSSPAGCKSSTRAGWRTISALKYQRVSSFWCLSGAGKNQNLAGAEVWQASPLFKTIAHPSVDVATDLCRCRAHGSRLNLASRINPPRKYGVAHRTLAVPFP